jgi:hypothetical protein
MGKILNFPKKNNGKLKTKKTKDLFREGTRRGELVTNEISGGNMGYAKQIREPARVSPLSYTRAAQKNPLHATRPQFVLAKRRRHTRARVCVLARISIRCDADGRRIRDQI